MVLCSKVHKKISALSPLSNLLSVLPSTCLIQSPFDQLTNDLVCASGGQGVEAGPNDLCHLGEDHLLHAHRHQVAIGVRHQLTDCLIFNTEEFIG